MAKSKRFKVRFHLAKGEHFMYWQVTDGQTGEVSYCDPKVVLMHLSGCRLHNQPGTARKVFEGADKTVCAWIACDGVLIAPFGSSGIPEYVETCFSGRDVERVSYNPKVAPNWRNGAGENVDKAEFDRVIVAHRSVFVGCFK
jgi:hypothetical protein